MPLPDADKKSPRVYTLLQNLDLENLSADNLADVGDPIAIEEANEDELRRLCLVAFARMVTKGSFDGWLSGGGGLVGVLPLTGTTDADQYDVSSCPPWNGATITTQSISGVKYWDSGHRCRSRRQLVCSNLFTGHEFSSFNTSWICNDITGRNRRDLRGLHFSHCLTNSRNSVLVFSEYEHFLQRHHSRITP